MTRSLLRTIGALVIIALVVRLIVGTGTWFEGDTNDQTQVEAVMFGFLSGLLIVSLVSLIKLIVGWFVAATRVELLAARLDRFAGESDEEDPVWDPFMVERLEDHRRTYRSVDALSEVEMYEEVV
jgi:hypothetical protein